MGKIREQKENKRKVIGMSESLGGFLKSKLKDRSMRVDEFLVRSNISRSSFYRILNGTQYPSREAVNSIISTLNFTGKEIIELDYYMGLMNVDENTLSAAAEITDMLFGSESGEEKFSSDVIYYDGDRYLRDFSDMADLVDKASEKKGFECSIKLVNCCRHDIIKGLRGAVLRLEKKGYHCEIEHLIGFSESNLKESVNALHEILPLLVFKNYSVRCGETTAAASEGIMKNFGIVDFSWERDDGRREKKMLCANFLDEGASVCAAINDPGIADFFKRSYDNLRKFYINGLIVKKQLQTFSAHVIDMEARHDLVLFKPDPCDSRVPFEAFEHLRDRVTTEEKAKFVRTFVGVEPRNEEEIEYFMEQTFVFLRERERSSAVHVQIDVCTMDGMRQFAESGNLSDHVDFIPPFDKTERRMVLESMIKRSSDPEDKYKLYLLSCNYADPDMLMVAYKDSGVLIENINPIHTTSEMPHCFVENAGLANAFISYAEREIPNKYAVSQVEAVEFLQSLIDEYC